MSLANTTSVDDESKSDLYHIPDVSGVWFKVWKKKKIILVPVFLTYVQVVTVV